MLTITATDDWRAAHPGAAIGLLEMSGVDKLNGARKPLLASDMIMRDASGIACSILYGQDNRSPISPQTSHVLYVAYAAAGVPAAAVEEQLKKIEDNVRLASSAAKTEQSRLLQA